MPGIRKRMEVVLGKIRGARQALREVVGAALLLVVALFPDAALVLPLIYAAPAILLLFSLLLPASRARLSDAKKTGSGEKTMTAWEKLKAKMKTSNKSLDAFWNDYANAVILGYFAIGAIVLSLFVLLALRSENYDATTVIAVSYVVLFIGACIGSGIATWRGRQFERQLQKEHFAQAINMLITQARGGDGASYQRYAALILLDDLSKEFLRDKSEHIADMFFIVNIRRSLVQQVPFLRNGKLDQALEGTRVDDIKPSLAPSE